MIDLEQIRRDPIEETELFKAVELTANIKARNRVVEFIERWEESGVKPSGLTGNMYGYHRFCFEKKKILMEDYGIEWNSPVELNIGVDFDQLAAECEDEE